MTGIALFGAGRIGRIHAANLNAHTTADIRHVVDVMETAANELATLCGARVSTTRDALADPEVQAVVIASPTDTHAELIRSAAEAGKAIFCEKPLDLDIQNARKSLAVVAKHGAMLCLGFNRRHDPSFARLKAEVLEGAVGEVEVVSITSRDPSPPPVEYLGHSGGLFRDMMIHDFDMARWLLGAEPVRLYARGSVLVDPAIGAAGDVDSAVVVLETADGVLCQIINSRRAAYGYDQRIEAFGEKGLLLAGNRDARSLQTWSATGITGEKPLYFFLERYTEAYRAEMAHFLACLAGEEQPRVNAEDGLRALELAEAANESLASGQAVQL